MSVTQINERSTAYLSVTLRDKLGAPVVPGAFTYSVYCLTNKQEIRAVTAVGTPGSTVEIVLDTDDTAIVNAANPFETRRITIEATYGPKDALRDQYDVVVKNLTRIS